MSAREDGGAPAVLARKPAPEGRPTVLLYAHHDVQPENDHAEWNSPPFEPTERDGRLFGRGAADDKAGIVAHLGAVRALGDDLGVGVTMFIEGEEEVGSDTLADLLSEHHDYLAADVIVIADSGNWDIGVPALTTSLRGLVRVDIEVRTLTHAVHSGMWGGLVPDALMTLSRLIASLHDDEGNVAVAGLHSGPAADVDYPAERLRAESGIAPGVEFIGSGSAVERLWTKPSLTITGIDAPKVDGASNTLVASARAKISLRIAPGDTTENALECLRTHLEAHVPWGAELELHRRRHRRGHHDRRLGSGVRRSAGRVHRGLGRHPPDRHGRGWVDPVHRRVPGELPGGERARHRGRGPGHACARRQRGAAPRGVRAGLPRRGAAAGEPRDDSGRDVTLSTEAVLELLQSVAAEVITPRFRSLSSAQIDEKKPGDLVTVADHESEELITQALLDAYPDAVVLGEEAYAGRQGPAASLPGRRARLHRRPGRRDEELRQRVARPCRDGGRGGRRRDGARLDLAARARDRMVAERGGGVRRNGEPVVASPPATSRGEPPRSGRGADATRRDCRR